MEQGTGDKRIAERWMDPLIDTWRSELEFRGATKATLDTWPRVVRRFLRVVGNKEQFGRQEVVSHLAELRRSKKRGSYRRQVFRILKTFYQANGWEWPFRRGECPKASEPQRPWLEYDEFLRVIEALKRCPRYHALFRLAGCTAARSSEISAMDITDYKRPHIWVNAIKRGRSGLRKLDYETCEVLDSYLATRKDREPCLFYSRNHTRITPSAMRYILRKVAGEIGLDLKRAGMHIFRRSFTTWAYKAGAREKEITDVVGWRTPTMVHEYIQLDREEAMAAVERAHPMFKLTDMGKPPIKRPATEVKP